MKLFLIKTAGCGEIYAIANTASDATKAVEEKLKNHTPLFGDYDKRILSIELFSELKNGSGYDGIVKLYRPKIDLLK